MRYVIPLVAMLGMTALTPAVGEGLEPLKLKDVKWGPCDPKMPKDPCQISYFRGNPETEPNFSYFKVPKGYLFSDHWHTGNSHLVVVKGSFVVGAENDPKGITLQAGDFIYEAAKVVHWGKCVTDECVCFLYVDGPDSYIDVKDRRP